MSLAGFPIVTDEITTEDAERLRARAVVEPDGCWVIPLKLAFPEYLRYPPYATFQTAAGRSLGAHRAAYAAWVGPVPAGLMVCHHCDRTRCIRPEHLFLGTASTNQLDRYAKGRGGDLDYRRYPRRMAS